MVSSEGKIRCHSKENQEWNRLPPKSSSFCFFYRMDWPQNWDLRRLLENQRFLTICQEKGSLTTVLPHTPFGSLFFFFPLDAGWLCLKSCRFQNKSTDIYRANLRTINAHQKGSHMVTYGIMCNYKSLLPGDQITHLCKVKKNLLGNSVGFVGKRFDSGLMSLISRDFSGSVFLFQLRSFRVPKSKRQKQSSRIPLIHGGIYSFQDHGGFGGVPIGREDHFHSPRGDPPPQISARGDPVLSLWCRRVEGGCCLDSSDHPKLPSPLQCFTTTKPAVSQGKSLVNVSQNPLSPFFFLKFMFACYCIAK